MSSNGTRVIFFGTPEFACPSLKALIDLDTAEVACVVTQTDKPAGRGNKVTSTPVARLAQSHKIPVVKPASIKKDIKAFLDSVSSYGPFDVAIVIAFGQILPEEALHLPRCGSINIHASLLPRWRGAAPMQRAIMAGDKETGVCLMQMDKGLDTGPVYRSSAIRLTENSNLGDLHDSLAALGANLLKDSLQDIVSGRIQPLSQPEEGVTYARKISKEEAEIDWSRDAKHLDRLIRALSPFPGAFTRIDKKRLKIYSATPKACMPGSENSLPGEVVRVGKNMLEVICGDGKILSLNEVQLEGKKRMKIDEFIRGSSIRSGNRFSF